MAIMIHFWYLTIVGKSCNIYQCFGKFYITRGVTTTTLFHSEYTALMCHLANKTRLESECRKRYLPEEKWFAKHTNFYKEKTATKIVVTRARWLQHCICGYGAKSLDELIQNDYNAVNTEKVSDVIWFY